jgi:uncharacterized membrane protein YdbT with pleckstrin-like domain
MQIKINKKNAIIINGLIAALPKLATVFVIVFMAGVFVLSSAVMGDVSAPWLPFALATIVFFVYLSKNLLESSLHAKETNLVLGDKSISCTISGLNTRSFSIPLNQISSIHVQQGFIDRIFGICRVVIVQIASTAVVYGFDYSDAVKLSERFANRQADKLAQKN